jgi:hypothetical protein
MQTRPCDVRPGSDQDKYTLALQDLNGRWYGLDVLLSSIFPTTTNAPQALQRIGFNSFHAGRGFDKFIPNQYGFYNSRNAWTTTAGKAHATPLFRWATGVNNADFNMPNANGVNWQPLLGATRYLDVSFAASASYSTARAVFLIRRRVPAGAVGVPGTLTIEICSDSAGNPGTVLHTKTITSADITDVTSEYYGYNVNLVLTSGTTYHAKIYGASTDRDNAHWEVAVDTTAAGKKSTAGSSWSATTYSPYYRLTAVLGTYYYMKFFIFDGALYFYTWEAAGGSRLFINGTRGRATSGSTTSLTDTGHGTQGATAWTTNQFQNWYLRCIRGTGLGQIAQITSNTATVLSFDAVETAFDNTSEYIVYGGDAFTEITSTGLALITGDPAISNGIVYFPQGDSTNIRIMHMDYSDADDHAFDVENTNNNKAYLLTTGYDAAEGSPQLWRANITLASGTPNGAAISVSRGPTAPLAGSPAIPTPLAFGTDVTFKTSILTGENTNRINNIFFHDNALYVVKENTFYIVQYDRAVNVKVGGESAPDLHNGAAICVADKQLYSSFNNDVYLISGGGAYPTNMQHNLPSGSSGYAADLEPHADWIFAAIDAGVSGTSSIMKYSTDTKTWSEQFRAPQVGRRMRSVQWQDCPGTRPRLWVECGFEPMVQEFPINGVRPYDDSGMKYQHEAVIELPTVDLQSVDSKYYSVLSITSQGLAQESDTEVGHEIVVEFQADNDVGTANWSHAGYIRTSPTGQVTLGQGDTRKLRVRLRLLQNEATDPVIIETIGLSLFSRHQLSEQWRLNFNLTGDDEEQNSLEFLKWLRQVAQTAEPIRLLSTFPLYHNRLVTLSNLPYYNLTEYDADAMESELAMQMQLTEVT